jgi:hypothetical protein
MSFFVVFDRILRVMEFVDVSPSIELRSELVQRALPEKQSAASVSSPFDRCAHATHAWFFGG